MKRKIPSCKEVNAFLSDFLEGTLDNKMDKRFRMHISMCQNCTAYLNQYQTVVETLHEQPEPDVPPELIQHTLRFLEDNLPGG
jgi:predicted anti-sigma-YlaC factor YlaD